MKFKKINLLIFILLLFTSVLLVETTLAITHSATEEVRSGLETTSITAGVKTNPDLQSMIGVIINRFFGVVAVVFLSIISLGGYFWIISRGNEESVAKAKTFILNGIFGLMIIFIAWGTIFLIANALKTTTTGS